MEKGQEEVFLGFDLYKALGKCSKYLEKYGGHEMAVGLTIKKENFNAFKEQFEKIAKEAEIKDIVPLINIDDDISKTNLKKEDIKELSVLEPYGDGNKMPLFLYKNFKIAALRTLSDGKHLKLTLKDDLNMIEAIAFNLGYLANEYLIGDKIDVVGNIEINNFNQEEKIQITIKDVRRGV